MSTNLTSKSAVANYGPIRSAFRESKAGVHLMVMDVLQVPFPSMATASDRFPRVATGLRHPDGTQTALGSLR